MLRFGFKYPHKCVLQRTLQQQNARQYNKRKNSNYRHGLPPNMREAGFGKVLLIVTPLAAVGGAITYAKYDKNFRQLVEKNVPGAESVIKVALNEEPPFSGIKKRFDEQVDSVKNSFDSATSQITSFFSFDQAAKKQTSPNREDATPKPKQPVQHSTASNTIPKTPQPVTAKQKTTPATPATVVKVDKAPEPLPKDVIALEKAIEHSATVAVKEYHKAIEVLKSFNDDVRNVVDQAVENIDNSLWVSLRNRTSARDSAVSTAEQMARKAIDKIGKCEVALSKVVTSENTAQVEEVRNKLKKYNDHINNVKDELYRQKDSANITEKYWRNVEKARNYFVEEIESIFPGLNLSEKKLDLPKEDLDLFILHAYSHVLTLNKELQRLQTDGELRLKRAIEAVHGANETAATKAHLDFLVEAEKRKIALENQKKIFKIHAESDKKLRKQLKQQTEAHNDHLNDVVRQKEDELKRDFSRELENKLSAERANYKLQLAGMLGKLRGMDAALAARAEVERSATQAQSLWAACQALWASVRTTTPGVHYKYKLRPLRNEIAAIAKVGKGDELVKTVLDNLPKEARERGVYPEEALRERFLVVERVARKVALVPEEGASIPIYVLSYLQSLFMLRPENPISQDELEDKRFDFTKLDTYDILNRARYHVDRSNFLQALKYMNLLHGAPRKISTDWVNETRVMLETQQAANTLMAHAAASGLLYL